jgi:hypothetical protein
MLHLAPLAGRGRRALARRVRGPLRESELVERPPHPDPLHSPSQTGVNALMASGEREQTRRAICDCPAFTLKGEDVIILRILYAGRSLDLAFDESF